VATLALNLLTLFTFKIFGKKLLISFLLIFYYISKILEFLVCGFFIFITTGIVIFFVFCSPSHEQTLSFI